MRYSSNTHVKFSKKISKILRFACCIDDKDIRDDGYISLKLIYNLHFKTDYKLYEEFCNDIKTLIKLDDKESKSRFELNDNNTENILVRATQGHNIKKINPDKIYDKYTSSSIIIHGTTLKHLISILIDGKILSKNRNEVHFALGYLDEKLEDGSYVKSGMRTSSTIGLEIDVTKARNDGITFYQARKNKVVLVPDSLSTKYINHIKHLDTNIEDELELYINYYIFT